ncbi:MAG: Antitoxin HigA-1 [Mycoplasmataceae bacterium]|nr:MAG: Antitoxin HigA-1 [Mycoplasmataceae bacterium]
MDKFIKIEHIHPSEFVLEEFMEPNEITIEQLANEIKMSIDEVNNFLINKDDFTADFSARLGIYFKVEGEFFYNLQNRYQKDILEGSNNFQEIIKEIKPFNYKQNSLRL